MAKDALVDNPRLIISFDNEVFVNQFAESCIKDERISSKHEMGIIIDNNYSLPICTFVLDPQSQMHQKI